MLTFTFTGVDGTMTEAETLTSGMVGKQLRLVFDESWDSLSKTAVFQAGDICRVVLEPEEVVTVPAEVLARPYLRLLVGVCGTDESGTVVIPTVMAEGPLIRCGADPVEDETAKELPVWENLQNQIGELDALQTEAVSDLVSAINELHEEGDDLSAELEALSDKQERDLSETERALDALSAFQGYPTQLQTEAKITLTAAINELKSTQDLMAQQLDQATVTLSRMGDPDTLDTESRDTLVDALNDLQAQLTALAQECVGFRTESAQLLVDILSRGLYTADQTEQVDTLAQQLGVTVTEDLSHLLYYWDFRTGSLTDRIGGLEATAAEDVTLDLEGAHFASAASYLMFPAGADGASLAGNTVEVKFGTVDLSQTATTLRLLSVCSGTQPASVGLQWSVQDCWTAKASVSTEFTELNMFSGGCLLGVCNDDASQIDWYFEDQLIASTVPAFVHSHLSLGSTASAAYPMTVEYIRIYPNT